jgi:glucose-1-phosphate thymidylyltransferase
MNISINKNISEIIRELNNPLLKNSLYIMLTYISGANFGARFTYEIQDEAGGIAQALSLAKDFADDEDVAVILGDNIFQDDVGGAVQSFRSGARIFLKAVEDAARFGVAEVDESCGQVLCIEEKPDVPKSDYAVTGLYIYESGVFDVIKTLKPSGRGELEITDVNNEYIRQGAMGYSVLEGYWSDAGTFGSLLRAGGMERGNIRDVVSD